MTRIIKQISLTVIILIIPFISEAQEKKDAKDTINLEELVITATKTLINRNNTPVTVSSVSSSEIEQSSESALLPVLSEHVPGLFVTERGVTGFGVATGSAGQINIRGIGGSPNTRVLVLLNGSPQYMGIMGHPLPDSYVASDVEKVEIIRGPASTLYGSNAMGGVINILTRKKSKDGFNANTRLMYGSYNTQKYMLNGGFRKKGFNIFASFNYNSTDGDRDSSEFKILNSYIKAGYKINEHINIDADFSYAKFKASDPGPETGNAGNKIDIKRGMTSFSVSNEFGKIKGTARFFYNFGEHKITDGFHSNDINTGVTVYESFNLFKGNNIIIGFDYKKYGGIAENILARQGEGVVFGDTNITETGVYIQTQQTLFNKLTLNAGLRYEYHQIYKEELVPSGGFALKLAKNTTLKSSIAKGFRSPTIRELYLWAPANENLEPERIINYEAGIIQSFLKKKLKFELTVFNVSGDNMIKIIVLNNLPQHQNTGEFSNTGIEFLGKYHINNIVSFAANYSYIYMKEPVLATPEHQFFLTGKFRHKNFRLSISIQEIINLYTKTGVQQEKETYTLLNSKISYSFNKYIELFVKAENILNQKYQINYDYPMPGIIFFGGINLHF